VDASLWRRVLDRAGDGIVLVERGTWRITYANAHACALLGYPQAEALAHVLRDFVPPEVWPLVVPRLEALTADADLPPSEWPAVRADGSTATLEVSARTLDDATLVLSFRDTSAQRAAEAALRQSERQFSTLVENSPDIIARFDADRRCVYLSPAAESATGRSLSSRLGRRPDEFTDIAPERAEAWMGAIESALRGEPCELEFTLAGPDGTRWYRSRLVPERNEHGVVESVLSISRDATDERTTMDALFQSAQRFRSLIENASDLIAVVDAQGIARYLSPAFSRVLGYPTGTLLGTPVLAMCHPDDLAVAQATLATIATASPDEVANVEVRARHADGSWRRFDVLARNLLGDPAVQGIVLNSRDVTEREELARAVREAHDHFATLVRASPFAIVSVDANYITQSWNPAAERIFGWSAAEVLGRPLPFIPDIEQESFAEIRSTALGGRTTAREVRRMRKDGTLVTARLLIVPLANDADEVVGVVGFFEDLTPQRRAEMALGEVLTALEYTAEGIARLDTSGRYVSSNATCAAMLGYSAADLVGMPWTATVHSADAEIVRGALARLEQRDAVTIMCRSVRRDGSVFDSRITLARILGSDGTITAFYCFRRDVTEERRLEEQLRQSQKMEAIGMLAGGVAHDFNNLLTVIQVNAELLREEAGPNSTVTDGVREIQRATERATALTRQLLAFSRRQLLQPRVLDLNERVCEVEGMLTRLIGADIRIVTHLQPDLGSVIADPGQIEQVLMNLAVNARDAMPRGGTLTIRTANVTFDVRAAAIEGDGIEPGDYVMLAVSDTGVGMSRETQSRMFEPFFTTKEPGKGTGLGLSTVFGIVKQSGGCVAVDSAPDAGTTVKIYLPCRAAVSPLTTTGSFRVMPVNTTATILLVEDGESVRRLASRILTRAGHTVIEAANGREALEVAARHEGEIDLILTDVVMPELNGRELVDRIRESRPGIRALYMSGYTDDEIVRRGLLSSDMAFIEKPFTSARLLERVQGVLQGA
jgi:PAS domain S-box-containing protein